MSKPRLKSSNAVICLAVFNGEKFLAELLDSLVTQSVQADIVVRDDGSSDGSLAIIRNYVAKYPFMRVVENGERGGSASLNFSSLLSEAVTAGGYSYYFFADQDDVWRPDKVELSLKIMARIEAAQPGRPVLLHSDLEVVDFKLKTIADSFFAYQGIDPFGSCLNTVLVENPATGCAMVINHRLASVVSPVSENAIMHDWWFVLVAYAIGARVEVIRERLVKYRQHTDNTLGAKKFGLRQIAKRVFRYRSLDLDRYYRQVQGLLTAENIELKDDVRIFLEAFVGTRNAGAVARLRFFLRFRIFKSSRVKNAGLMLLLMTY